MTNDSNKPQFMYCDEGQYIDELSLRLDALVSDMFHISGEFACTGSPSMPEKHMLPTVYRLFREVEIIKDLFDGFMVAEGHFSDKPRNTEDIINEKYGSKV